MTDRDKLNALPCEAPDVENEAEHFMLCPRCSQAFDMRRLGDVLWHDEGLCENQKDVKQ